MSSKNQIIVGITGYLGSGKTTVLRHFGEHGFYTIDADKIVHELYEPGNDGWRKIKDFFGEEYLMKNGKVNRRKLGKTVFCNPAKLRILEKIIHPLVFNEINKQIQACISKGILKIAIEAIRFDEKRMGTYLTHIVWVDTHKDIAYKRVIKKRKLSRDDYMKIIDYQKKPEHIDFVIKNNGNIKELKIELDSLLKIY